MRFLLPSLLPGFVESIVESWLIEAAKLSILPSILMSRYVATVMGKPKYAETIRVKEGNGTIL